MHRRGLASKICFQLRHMCQKGNTADSIGNHSYWLGRSQRHPWTRRQKKTESTSDGRILRKVNSQYPHTFSTVPQNSRAYDSLEQRLESLTTRVANGPHAGQVPVEKKMKAQKIAWTVSAQKPICVLLLIMEGRFHTNAQQTLVGAARA